MPTTTNFGWTTPADTDLVKDGASAIRTLGSGIDTTMVGLKGGSSGQVLTKSSATDMAFSWTTLTGDITEVTTSTTSGLSGGATSGAVALRLKLEFDNQTGTTYTLVAGNINQLVTLNNASSITLTIPPSVFSAGDVINIAQLGAGQVTFAQGAGVTINSTGATATAPKLRARYSAASVICTASNTFLVVGDIV